MIGSIWLIICGVTVIAGFLPNKLINTNCRYIYIGSLIIILGALVGLSGRPVIAATIVFLGIVVLSWAAMYKLTD
ncbi:hypothetical protein [Psychrobacter aquaticus]|uniref:Uncharacterized protein n=1 Tax=Psychrobacter aquaticus CMS 56 TaxID=1354303 RepID=U4T445_9GAMM|nr:hypothetical protein [Psychrobacter aquaticus]ERL54936.1 hypothetical protein M917_2282 [Psychrobacter aquaticus CMS 56]